jgi:hypothetical protein
VSNNSIGVAARPIRTGYDKRYQLARATRLAATAKTLGYRLIAVDA